MDKKLSERVYRTMFKQKICSEHGALCYLEAVRRDNAKKRKAKKQR